MILGDVPVYWGISARVYILVKHPLSNIQIVLSADLPPEWEIPHLNVLDRSAKKCMK